MFLRMVLPIDKTVELEDGAPIPILHFGRHYCSVARQATKSTMALYLSNNILRTIIWASETILIPVKSPAWVSVQEKRHGLVVL